MSRRHQKLIEQRDVQGQPLLYVVVAVCGRPPNKRVEITHGHVSITEAENCARCHLQYLDIAAGWDEEEATREIRHDIEPDPQHEGRDQPASDDDLR